MPRLIMNKEDFFKIHNRITTKNIEINNELVSFEIEHATLEFIKGTGYDYRIADSIKIRLGNVLKKYYMVILGLLFLFSLIYINTFRVGNIFFNIETPINDSIEASIKSNYKELFCFSFSNADYQRLSSELRVKYSEYPYINVYSKNNDIYVDIYTYNDDYTNLDVKTKGDIVAKKDGLISYFYIYQGDNKVSTNKFVREGDLLVSGMINNKSVGARALIMANTYEKIEIEVLKKESMIYETGKVENYHNINFFNKTISMNKKNSYQMSNIKEANVFNVFDVFSVKKIEEREKNAIIEENTLETAIIKGEKIIKDDFELNKKCEDEEIVDLKMYMYVEDEEKYQITYIAKKLESIGSFKESNDNEVEFTNW